MSADQIYLLLLFFFKPLQRYNGVHLFIYLFVEIVRLDIPGAI